MQNCLHSKKIKSVMMTVVLLLLTAFAVLLVHGEYGENTAKKQYNTKYLAVGTDSAENKSSKSGELFTESKEKMNNSVQKNAKIYVSEHEKSIYDGKRADFVNVLMPDGNVLKTGLEKYVLGCVYGEMPLYFETEALMAQSIASRTFAVNMICGSSKHKNADVCTSPACCQKYTVPCENEIGSEKYKKLCDGVRATKGVVIICEGQPIQAVFHASSGSNTLSSEEVWGGYLEYLRAVKAPEGESEISANGMGHRVGMSQHGANLLAKEGKNCFEILKYYYSGISFGFI